MIDKFTYGKHFNPGKIAHIFCTDSFPDKSLDIKDKCFLLVFISEGYACFEYKGNTYSVSAPSFVSFSEKENPVLKDEKNLRCLCIFFHPRFLNVNMEFDLMRSDEYPGIAQTHDLFLLRPFNGEPVTIPVPWEYAGKITGCFEDMRNELETQRDWYWSCRSRSYFMEIILILERLYGLKEKLQSPGYSSANSIFNSEILQKAVQYIESNYSRDISLKDIVKNTNTNHTTLTKYFREELDFSPVEYIWKHRIDVAKKHLAFTEIPVRDVAERCGFKTVQHFCYLFRKNTGKSPGVFRNEAVDKRKKQI